MPIAATPNLTRPPLPPSTCTKCIYLRFACCRLLCCWVQRLALCFVGTEFVVDSCAWPGFVDWPCMRLFQCQQHLCCCHRCDARRGEARRDEAWHACYTYSHFCSCSLAALDLPVHGPMQILQHLLPCAQLPTHSHTHWRLGMLQAFLLLD